MPSFLKKQAIRYPLYLLMLISAATTGVLAYHNIEISIISFVLYTILFINILRIEIRTRKETENYIITFSERFDRIAEEAVAELPIGILLYNEENEIEWVNHYLKKVFEEKVNIGVKLTDLSEELQLITTQKTEIEEITIDNKIYQINHKRNHKLFYFTDISEKVQLEKSYKEEKVVICLIFVDNYDDVTQGMDDSQRSRIRSFITSELNDWALEHGILLKRLSSDRFIGVLNEKILETLEKNNFSILDDIRESTLKQNIPLTLSIGVGSGEDTLPELNSLAQSGLDLALGRGGDQAAIKMLNGKTRFFGGKTNPAGKRTRVRARVISHALKDLVTDSENVIIMGHKNPDMDVIGSAVGLLRIAKLNDRAAFVVIDKEEMDISVYRLLEEIQKSEEMADKFIDSEEALEIIGEKSLLIVIDTNRPSLVIDQKLLKTKAKIVIIDHHRRGEEIIENPILTYIEPYASSTAELVSEMLEYHPNCKKIDMIEATALLAGIIVDTKSFTLRTGARTFDAASFLKLHGADTALIQTILKENITTFVERNKLIEQVYFYKEGLAITKGKPDKSISRALIAKTADTLLSMEKVAASFVIAKNSENTIAISSRSLGEINVQLIMEKIGGGGHLTNAATQLVNVTIDEAEILLKQAIDEYLEGRNE